jgi:hypothetical protein
MDWLDRSCRATEDLPTYEIQLRRRRSRWTWLVRSHDGRPVMQGYGETRAMASYFANRALFLLLSTANLCNEATCKRPRGRKPAPR